MQKFSIKKIFVLIILFFASNAFSQKYQSAISVYISKHLQTGNKIIFDESGRIIFDENAKVIYVYDANNKILFLYDENGRIIYVHDENLDKQLRKLLNLFDDEKLNSDIKTIIESENIDVAKIDCSNEILFYVKIYAFIIDNQHTYYIGAGKNVVIESTCAITIEIGTGITPMANVNGILVDQIMNIAIVHNDKIIGTVRWWDISNMPVGTVGRFLFVNSDWQANVLYDLIPFSMEE
ncbi:MAG: hypothetical protein FWG92_03000 [Leptospirales bacterium]|nr:hypothetical protein [Leptospirales bacterium]